MVLQGTIYLTYLNTTVKITFLGQILNEETVLEDFLLTQINMSRHNSCDNVMLKGLKKCLYSCQSL